MVACFAVSGVLRAWDFILLPPDASESLFAAVEDLADALVEAEGKRPQVLSSRWRFPQNALYIGDTPVTVFGLRLPRTLSRHGSISRRAPGERVYLRARTDAALVDGVYGLAQEWAGARWYWPGDLGLVVSAGKGSEMFDGFRRRVDEPAFIHRSLWPSGRVEDGGAFGRRNRLHGAFQFNHALGRIFTPELFDERPELFATRNGVQQRPRGSAGTDPQPHLASEETVRYAADAVLAYFEENPQAISFSLSINDNILFDDTELTRAIVEPITYFRNKPNYTDLVFTFMNRVAQLVFDEAGAWTTEDGQPRYLTALAYYWAEQSPSFPLHPRVVPILTADRAQWHDPEFRAEDKALIERWGNSGAEVIGTWDYLFGGPYPYPRQFNRHIIDSIRHMANHNVQVYFAQLAFMPGWDAAKLHLTARLLWSPDEDAEAIISQFYEDFFGPAAAAMRTYFEAFEQERERREGTAEWIKLYKDEAAVELFTENFLQQQQQQLKAAMQQVDPGSIFAQRLAIVERDLAFTLSYHRFQTSRSKLVAAIGESSSGKADAATVQDQLIRSLKNYRQARRDFSADHAEFAKVPYYARHVRWLTPGRQSDPALAALGALAALNWQGELDELGIDDGLIVETYNRFRAAGVNPPVQLLSLNPRLFHTPEPAATRYLFPSMPNIPQWSLDLRPTEKGRVTSARGDDWNTGVRFTHVDAASLFADFPVDEDVLMLLESELRYRASPDCRITIEVIWSDATGKRISSQRLAQLPVDWSLSDEAQSIALRIPLLSPSGAASARPRIAVSRQFDGDFLAVESFSLAVVENAAPLND